jgi:hypothetical protein
LKAAIVQSNQDICTKTIVSLAVISCTVAALAQSAPLTGAKADGARAGSPAAINARNIEMLRDLFHANPSR